MTGFALSPPVRGDAAAGTLTSGGAPKASSPATCCDPMIDVYCHEGKRLDILRRRGEKLAHEYGDNLPLNLAVGDLADHLRVDRTSVLTGIENLHRGSPDVRSQTRVP